MLWCQRREARFVVTGLRATRSRGLAALVAALIVDQMSKAAALAWLRRSEVVELAPFFNLRLAFNRGVSFGMLGDGAIGPLALSALSALIVAMLVVWMWRTTSPIESVGLGLVAGGAVGNIVDRMRQGEVTDFLDVHLADWHWPTFNLADSSITVGVALLLIGGWLVPTTARR